MFYDIINGTKNLMYMFDCALSEIIVYATHIPKLFNTYICKYKRSKKFTETMKKFQSCLHLNALVILSC